MDRARRALVAAKQHAGRPGLRDVGLALVEAFGVPELEMRRQRHPELKAAGPAGISGAAGMPDPLAGAHPLHAAGAEDAGGAIGVLVAHAAFGDIGQGGEARVRMQAEGWETVASIVEQIKEDEGLQQLAEAPRAHQSRDVAMGSAAGAIDHRAGWSVLERKGGGHDGSSV